MATRPECIQSVADLLGDTFVTTENHARSMGSALGPYSTKIGRGHRNVDLAPEWIASLFLAGVRNDPKNAATKVPELGDLTPSRVAYVERTLYRAEPPPAGRNMLFPSDYTEEKRGFPTFIEPTHNTLFDLLCFYIEAGGHWFAGSLDERDCPVPEGLTIEITLEPEPMAVVAFDLSNKSDPMDLSVRARVVRYYTLAAENTMLAQEDAAIPLTRSATISRAHILRLSQIYAHSLIALKVRAEFDAQAIRETESKPENEKAGNPGRSPASSETLSHDGPGITTGTTRRNSLASSDPSVCVHVTSRGFTPKGRSHEYASHHHAVL